MEKLNAIKGNQTQQPDKPEIDLKSKIYDIVKCMVDEEREDSYDTFMDVISPDDDSAKKLIRLLKGATKMQANTKGLAVIATDNGGTWDDDVIKRAYYFCEDALYYADDEYCGNILKVPQIRVIKFEYSKIEDCQKTSKGKDGMGDVVYDGIIKHDGVEYEVVLRTSMYDAIWELVDLSRNI